MSSTADPMAARNHARAMAGIRVEAMPTIPARADDAGGEVVWEEITAAGGYTAHRIDRGTRLRLIDLRGDACVSMQIFNADTTAERLNVADTIKIQWNAYLAAGRLLLSDMGRVLASIVADDTAGHDVFCGTSNAGGNRARYGEGDNHGACPNGRDRLALAAAKSGLSRKDIHPCVTWFKPVRIGPHGATDIDIGPFTPGRRMELRAEMNLLILLANCPHVLDPRPGYCVTPVRVTAWRGQAAAADDPIRLATPEGARAFQNVDAYFSR